jgi:hypothetical protein
MEDSNKEGHSLNMTINFFTYLAHSSFKLSYHKRHQVIGTLINTTTYEATKPFKIVYFLSMLIENGPIEKVQARNTNLMRSKKCKKYILI